MATTGKINGHDLFVFIDGTAVSHSTTCSVTMNTSEVDMSSKDSLKWSDFKIGVRDWTMETSGMVALDATKGVEEVMALIESQASVTVKFSTVASAGDRFFSGTAYPVSLTLDAPDESPATFSVSFEGTGKLKFATT